MLVELTSFHLRAHAAKLFDGPRAAARRISRNRSHRWARTAADFAARTEERQRPVLGNEQLGIPTAEIDHVTLAEARQVDAVEELRQFPDQPNLHSSGKHSNSRTRHRALIASRLQATAV